MEDPIEIIEPGVFMIYVIYSVILLFLFRYYYLLGMTQEFNSKLLKYISDLITLRKADKQSYAYLYDNIMTIDSKMFFQFLKWKPEHFIHDKFLLFDVNKYSK